jgi:hypothetical protein
MPGDTAGALTPFGDLFNYRAPPPPFTPRLYLPRARVPTRQTPLGGGGSGGGGCGGGDVATPAEAAAAAGFAGDGGGGPGGGGDAGAAGEGSEVQQQLQQLQVDGSEDLANGGRPPRNDLLPRGSGCQEIGTQRDGASLDAARGAVGAGPGAGAGLNEACHEAELPAAQQLEDERPSSSGSSSSGSDGGAAACDIDDDWTRGPTSGDGAFDEAAGAYKLHARAR